MPRLQIAAVIFFTCLICISAEEKKANARIGDFLEPPAPTEAPSYFSKLKNWLFPFGGNADPPRPSQPSTNYLPPSKVKECNPCDEEPWVPIISSHGKNKAIDFVHASELNRPKNEYGPPKPAYGPPNGPQHIPSGHGNKINLNKHPRPAHNAPNHAYGPPKPIYGAPNVAPTYGPPTPIYRPPNLEYNPLKPTAAYGPPNIGSSYGPPNPTTVYRPPNVGPSYGPPKPTSSYGPPNVGPSYGPPNIGPLYGPPKPYISNIRPSYGPPNIAPTYGPPNPTPVYGPPKPNSYGPPKPPPAYGAQVFPSNSGSGNHRDPGPRFQSRPPKLHNGPKEFLSAPPPTPNFKPPNVYGSPSLGMRPPMFNGPNRPHDNYPQKYTTSPINFVTPARPNVNYGVPSVGILPPPPSPQPLHVNSQPGFTRAPQDNLTPPSSSFVTLPSGPATRNQGHFTNRYKSGVDSYGPPPSGPVRSPDDLVVTSPEYIPPAQSLPIASGTNDYVSTLNVPPNNRHISNLKFHEPIPFPNMSPNLVLPLHNAQPFDGVYGGDGNTKDIQVVKSVAVSSFGSVDYPPTVVQSPLIDISVEDKTKDMNLNSNPIIVDGDIHHQEASFTSVAIHNETINKRGNDDELSNPGENHQNDTKKVTVQIDPSLQTLYTKDDFSEAIAKQLFKENVNKSQPFQKTNPAPEKDSKKLSTNIFTPPPMDYSSWSPSNGVHSSSVNPPHEDWSKYRTTKTPKQIQIIVPYVTNNNDQWYQNQGRKIPPPTANTLFSNLPNTEESQWTKFMPHPETNTKPATVSNIRDLLKGTHFKIDNSQHLPFDIVDLQKNIDVWTELEYNNARSSDVNKISTKSRLTHSKKIPDDFLPTQSYDVTKNEITTVVPIKNSKFFDYEASGTYQHSIKTNIESNLTNTNLIDQNNPQKLSESLSKDHVKSNWENTQISVSPLTRERVYVVTPQPIRFDSSTPFPTWTYVPKNEIQEINKQLSADDKYSFTSPRFAVRPEPGQKNKTQPAKKNDTIHVIYEDWPRLINSLETTTSVPKAPASTTQHPLLGRMDLSSLTPQGPVQTHTGHSKVASAVTPSNAPKKKTGLEEKKTPIKTGEKV